MCKESCPRVMPAGCTAAVRGVRKEAVTELHLSERNSDVLYRALAIICLVNISLLLAAFIIAAFLVISFCITGNTRL